MNCKSNKFRKNSIEERARKVFGETEYFELAGYLLRNGSMLNFSYGGYQRDEDHRIIGQFYSKAQGTEALRKFMRRGNIRCMCSNYDFCFEFDKLPTREQFEMLNKAHSLAIRNALDFRIERECKNKKYRVFTWDSFCDYLRKYADYYVPEIVWAA